MNLIQDNIPINIKNMVLADTNIDSNIKEFVDKVIIHESKKFKDNNFQNFLNTYIETKLDIQSISSKNKIETIFDLIVQSLKSFVFVVFIKKITPHYLENLNECFGYINIFMTK